MPRARPIRVSVEPLDKSAVLRAQPVFADLDPADFDRLCGFAKTRHFQRGAQIFSKGDPGTSLFVMASGTVKIGVSSSDGRDAIFNLIGPGEMFGEVALFDGLLRSADAIANTDCQILVIDRREFLPFVQTKPLLAMKFIELLCGRLRWISAHVEQVILPDLPSRLAKAIIRLADKNSDPGTGGKLIVTQQELGEMVGMSRESINKQLQVWSAQRWVRLEHGGIIVLNDGQLRSQAETI